MPRFNLKSKRGSESALAAINNLLPRDQRISGIDLYALSEKEKKSLVTTTLKMKKVAIHGTGDGWYPLPADYNPYTPNPLSTATPEFGGNSRDQEFGRNSDATNKENDLQGKPSESGQEKIEDSKKKTDDSYLVIWIAKEGQDPAELAERMGENAEYARDAAYLTVNSYEDAIRVQRMFPGSVIETKGK